jgi:molybdenum cofactor cytidylyltransferase
MVALGLSRLFAVMAVGSPPPGFQAVMNGDPQAGQGRSLSLGVRAAQTAGAEAVLVLLGDMPLVSIDHARRVLDCLDGPATLAASEVGGRRCPPALFGSAWFDMLQAINGDEGARLLLGRAKAVPASADELMDVDQPADLVTALDRLKTRESEERE